MFLERQFVKGKGSHFLKSLIFMTVGGRGGCLLRYKVTIMCMAGCQLDFVKKIGFFKRFNFQKERFLMPEKSFFLLHAYLNKNSKR